MIEPLNQQLSISRQCCLLDVSRSSFYYRPKPINPKDLDLMRKIDELYLQDPTSGSRSIKRQLRRQGIRVNRKRIQRLMRLMGIEAVYPKPRTSRPHPQHRIYPYRYGIINHCDYPIHTGKLEGVNNKIKVIKRKAYGFHDLRYFTLKIYQAFSN